MATARDLLAVKGHDVHTVSEDCSVLQATRMMNEHEVGCAVVTSDATGSVVGIFTERDVLRRVVVECRDPSTTPVAQVMTERVVVCSPETALQKLRALCAQKRVRHLPVLDDDESLVGLISIGDINAWDLRDGQVTIRYMQQYIQGRM